MVSDDRGVPNWTLVAAALVSAGLVLLVTSKYGIAYYGDSARYVSVARSLLEGAGFTEYTGEPYVAGGPLYPILLAAGGVLGADMLVTARYLQAVLFGLTVLIGGAWLAQTRAYWPLSLIGVLLMVTSIELMDLATTALTDMPFIAFTVLFLSRLDAFLKESQPRWLLIAAAAAALASLTRYIGITLVITGGILLLTAGESRNALSRVKHAIVFGIIASAPTAIWVLRNYTLSSTSTGKMYPPFHTFGDFALSVLDVLGTWFLPSWVSQSVRILVGASVLLLVCLGLLVAVKEVIGASVPRTQLNADSMTILTASAFAITYLVVLVALASRSFFSSTAARYTAPAFVPIVVVLIALASRFGARRQESVRRLLLQVTVVLAASTLVWPARLLVGRIRYATQHGAGGYASTRWRQSEVLRYFRTQQPTGAVFTNEPNAMYFLANVKSPRWIPAHELPHSPISSEEALKQLRDSLSAHSSALVVRFSETGLQNYQYGELELVSAIPLQRIAALSDGEIYRFKR